MITLKSLLHLRQKVITFRTLLHLGSFITFRPSTAFVMLNHGGRVNKRVCNKLFPSSGHILQYGLLLTKLHVVRILRGLFPF